MECPNCNTPIKFLDLIRINHKNPYECPVCFKKSGFNHSNNFLSLVGGLAGLAGVIFFYSFDKYGWYFGIVTLVILLFIFLMIFLKYAQLEVIEEDK